MRPVMMLGALSLATSTNLVSAASQSPSASRTMTRRSVPSDFVDPFLAAQAASEGPTATLPQPYGTYTCPDDAISGTCYPATETAAASYCGTKGNLTAVKPYQIMGLVITQYRLEDCALICQLQPGCKSYGFDPWYPIGCFFSNENLVDSGFVEDSKSRVSWHDVDCAICVECHYQIPLPDWPIFSLEALCEFKETRCVRKAEIEPGYSCDVGGVVQTAAYSRSASTYPGQNSAQRCAAICFQEHGCKASAFDPNQKTCVFSHFSLGDPTFVQQPGESVRWSDLGCWGCPKCLEIMDEDTFMG